MNNSMRDVFQEVKEYVELRLEQFSLNTSEVLSHWVAIVLQKFFAISILVLALFFLMFALAQYIGGLLGNDYYGYLIIGLLMIILSIVFLSDTPRLLFRSMKYRMISDVSNRIGKGNDTFVSEKGNTSSKGQSNSVSD